MLHLVFIILSSFFFGEIIKKRQYEKLDRWEEIGLILHPFVVVMASAALLMPHR